MKCPLICIAFAAMVLTGCQGGINETSLIGKYKREVKTEKSAKDDPMAKMAEAMMSMLTMDLELKAGKKFTLNVVFIPISGDWTLSGNTITLTPTTFMGLTPEEFAKENQKENKDAKSDPKEMTKPIRLEVQPDGKSLKALDDIGGEKTPGDFVFTKKES